MGAAGMADFHQVQDLIVEEVMGTEGVTDYGSIIHEDHTFLIADGGPMFVVLETMEVAGGEATVTEMWMMIGDFDHESVLADYQARVSIDGKTPIDGWQDIYP